MRSLITFFVLLAGFTVPGWLAYAQSSEPASKTDKSASVSATKEEVDELRQEVADLKAQLRRLIQTNAQVQDGTPHLALVNAVTSSASNVSPDAPATVAEVEALASAVSSLEEKAKEAPPVTAGWNGEHFFLKSTDGNFKLMPVGYLNGQYTFYKGDGAPPTTFSITRARFGVQGNYGKQLDYAFLFETASALTIRDAFMDFKPWSAFKIMAGQYKVPFSMEVGTADTSVEFYNRSIISVLYPDAAGGFPRSRIRCSR